MGLENLSQLLEQDLAVLCDTLGERLSLWALIKKLQSEVSSIAIRFNVFSICETILAITGPRPGHMLVGTI